VGRREAVRRLGLSQPVAQVAWQARAVRPLARPEAVPGASAAHRQRAVPVREPAQVGSDSADGVV